MNPINERLKRHPLNFSSNIFDDVKHAASGRIRELADPFLDRSHMSGNNLFGLNPTRTDKNPTSFCINVTTGVWADFATGDRGGDIISFYAYVNNITQIEAAKDLASKLGVSA